MQDTIFPQLRLKDRNYAVSITGTSRFQSLQNFNTEFFVSLFLRLKQGTRFLCANTVKSHWYTEFHIPAVCWLRADEALSRFEPFAHVTVFTLFGL